LAGLASLLVVAVAAAGSAFGQDGQAEAPLSFEADIQPLLNQQCYACHLTGAASGELALEPGVAYQQLVEVPSSQSELLRVAPGDPEASYLVHKLRGTHLEVGGEGTRMPQGGAGVAEQLLDRVVRWIEAGAPPG
jgi:hypothetical protein